GIIPGILLGVFLIVTVIIISKIKGYDDGMEKVSWKKRLKATWDALFAVLMPIIILGGIYSGIFTPTEAAAVAVFYAFVIGMFVYKELKPRLLVKVLGEASTTSAVIMVI